MRYLPVILGIVLIIYGLIDCLRSEPSDVRSIPKPAWILVILLLPLIGVILWFLFGRPQYAASTTRQGTSHAGRSTHYVAPDDDPAFLRTLEINRAHKAEAERLRKLKEELDAREAKIREEHPNDETQH